MEKRIAPWLAEQIARTYPNRERPVEPSTYELAFQQSETCAGWYPAPWYQALAQPEPRTPPTSD